MATEECKTTNTRKCHQCKQTLDISHFTDNDKVYSKCNDCRERINNRKPKNLCEVCGIRACFNYDGQKQGKYCKEHKEVGMVDIKHSKCIKCEKKVPCFNKHSETVATHCGDCKEVYMINVIERRKCIKCEKKRPNFNKPGETVATHCGDCKEVYMIDIIHPKCIKCEKKRPNFNKPGETVATHCGDCKEVGMINITHSKCIKCEKKRPNFNKPGETVATHCGDCKEVGMIDVIHSRCQTDGCNTRVQYGYCGQSPILCAKHRDKHSDKNRLFIKPKRVCIGNDDEECKDIAEYGKTEPTHCHEHKTEDEIHLVAQICKQCSWNDLLNKDGLCVNRCAPNRVYIQIKQEKKKEKLVMNYLDKYVNLSNIIDIKDDKIVDSRCNKTRPDRIYDVGTHCIIIEVDEDQHKGDRSSCCKGEIGELARMHEIQNAIGLGLHCIFLRFNPDNFRVAGKLQKVNMNERLKILVKWIEKCAEMKPDRELQPVKYKYLFYDEYNETDVSFLEIDDTQLCNK
jgi:hypothetical protein